MFFSWVPAGLAGAVLVSATPARALDIGWGMLVSDTKLADNAIIPCTNEKPDSIRLCVADLRKDLDPSVIQSILGPTATGNINANLDVAQKIFAELLKARALQAETTQMAFRDGIDQSALASANPNTPKDANVYAKIVEKSQNGTLAPSSLSVDPACTGRYPDAELIRSTAAREFMLVKDSEAPAHDKRIRDNFDAFVKGKVPDPGCGKKVDDSTPMMSSSLLRRGQRVLEADEAVAALKQAKAPEGDLAAAEARLSSFLTTDPALNENIPTEKGGCDPKPEKPGKQPTISTVTCQPLYYYLGKTFQMGCQYGYSGGEKDAREAYQAANAQMKGKLLTGVSYTCKGDGSEFVRSPAIAAQVLADYPGFAPLYCRTLRTQLGKEKRDDIAETTLKWAGYGAVAASTISMFFSFGATAPLAAAALGTEAAVTAAGMGAVSIGSGVVANGLFSTRAVLGSIRARQNEIVSTEMVSANAADPRLPGWYAKEKEKYDAEFRKEMTSVLTTGGTMIAGAGLKAVLGKISAWRAAGKVTEFEEGVLNARASRIYLDTLEDMKKVQKVFGPPALQSPRYAAVVAASEKNFGAKVVSGVEAQAWLENYALKSGKTRVPFGAYDASTGKIFLRSDAPFETLLHEIRHAAQRTKANPSELIGLVRNFDFKQTEKMTINGKVHEITDIARNITELDVDIWQAQTYLAGGRKQAAQVIASRLQAHALSVQDSLSKLETLETELAAGYRKLPPDRIGEVGAALGRVRTEIKASRIAMDEARKHMSRFADLYKTGALAPPPVFDPTPEEIDLLSLSEAN